MISTDLFNFQKKIFYEILQVDRKAKQEVIKIAYKAILKKLKKHPDLGGDTEKAKLIDEAYSVLKNPNKRKKYDEYLRKKENSKGFNEVELILKKKIKPNILIFRIILIFVLFWTFSSFFDLRGVKKYKTLSLKYYYSFFAKIKYYQVITFKNIYKPLKSFYLRDGEVINGRIVLSEKDFYIILLYSSCKNNEYLKIFKKDVLNVEENFFDVTHLEAISEKERILNKIPSVYDGIKHKDKTSIVDNNQNLKNNIIEESIKTMFNPRIYSIPESVIDGIMEPYDSIKLSENKKNSRHNHLNYDN